MIAKKCWGPNMGPHVPARGCVVPKNEFWLHGEEQQNRCPANNNDGRQSLPVRRICFEALCKARPSAQRFRFGLYAAVTRES